MTRGVALSLVVMLATAASTMSRAAGTTTTIPGAKLTTITSRGDARSATLVIEATEPVPYVATRPDPLTVVVDFRNVAPGSLAANTVRLAGPIASVDIESAESMGSPVSRVRIGLTQPVAHHVRADRNRVLIDFDRAADTSVPSVAPPVARQASQPVVQSGVDPVAALGLTASTRPQTPGAQQLLAAGGCRNHAAVFIGIRPGDVDHLPADHAGFTGGAGDDGRSAQGGSTSLGRNLRHDFKR